MGSKKRSKKAQEDVAREVGDVSQEVSQARNPVVTGPLSGNHPAESQLREIHPDPANRAGVRDTAGDRVDHG